MPTKITFLYANPTDPDAFETAWKAGHLDLVRALPGLQRLESSKVWPKEDGSPTPAHRSVDAYFADYAAAVAATRTPQAAALFPAAFALASGGLQILFSDVEIEE